MDSMHSNLYRIVVLITLLIWFAVLLLYSTYEKMKKKISAAKTLEEMSQFRCSTVKKRMKTINRFRKFFNIMLIIMSLNFIFGSILRAILVFRESTSFELGQILSSIFKPVSVFILMFSVGAYMTTKLSHDFFLILAKKCEEMEILEEK